MTNEIKALGVTVVALLALAASAGTASAAPSFHLETAPATFTGESGTLELLTEEGTTSCKLTAFRGTTNGIVAASIELAPEYRECLMFGFIGATINPEECKYRLDLVEGSSPATAAVSVVCPSGQSIRETNPICTVTIGTQTGLHHVVFTNNSSKTTRDLKASVTVEGITYTASSGCSSPGTFNNATWRGEITLRADNSSGAQQGLWVE
ncbi:MAG TPA: hypothetical protein VF731_04630 [Solirubrobacterales bacterium]